MFNFFRYQYSSQISKLNSNIILYTKQNQNFYGSFCIYFVGGYRAESLQQQGSLLTLKNIKDQQITKFLIQSSTIQNNQCQLEYYFLQNIFLNEDFEAALEYLCQEAFTQIAIPKQFQQIRQIFNENYASNFRIEIERLIFEQFCLQKYTKQSIPQCQDFVNFQNTQITCENCIIGYSGEQIHEKIVETFEKNINKYKEFLSRSFIPNYFYQQYTNKTVRIEDNVSSIFEMALIFESSSCQNEEVVLIDTILAEILGRITDIQTDIGIKIKSRCYDRLLQFNQDSLFEAGCLQQNFSDFGVFSLILKGSMNEKRKIYDLAIEEVKKLKKISDNEIIRAKNIAITKYFMNLQRQYEQLNFDLKNIHILGQIIDSNEYKMKIDNISKRQIEKRVNQLLKQEKLIILYRGRNVDFLPDEKMTLMTLNY